MGATKSEKSHRLGYGADDKGFLPTLKKFASRNGALIGLIILCAALSCATPAFLTSVNILNVGIQAATVAILA